MFFKFSASNSRNGLLFALIKNNSLDRKNFHNKGLKKFRNISNIDTTKTVNSSLKKNKKNNFFLDMTGIIQII